MVEEQVQAPNAKEKAKAKAKYTPRPKNLNTTQKEQNSVNAEASEVPRNAGSQPPNKQEFEIPFEFKTIDFGIAEENLRCATLGADHTWAEKTPQEYSSETLVTMDSDCEDEGEDFRVTREKLLTINKHKDWTQFKDKSDHLVAYLKGFVLKSYRDDTCDISKLIDDGLDNLVLKGLPQIQSEAHLARDSRSKRNGKEKLDPNEHIQFGISVNKGPMWETNAIIKGLQWRILDFGDLLPWSYQDKQLIDDLKGPIQEKNQCLFIHVAAGLVLLTDTPDLDLLPKVRLKASSLRAQAYSQAKE